MLVGADGAAATAGAVVASLGAPAAVSTVVSAAPSAPVIDSGDFLRAPEAFLRALCGLFCIEFTDRMLAWPAGPRAMISTKQAAFAGGSGCWPTRCARFCPST